MLNDLSHYLIEKGFTVEVYAMAPTDDHWQSDGISYYTVKQRCRTRFRQFNDCHYFAHALQSRLKNSHADVVHCLNYFDAFAAIRARQKYALRYKVCFHAVGIPVAKYFRAVPLDKWFMHTTLKYADMVFALSQFACERLRVEFNCNAELLPPPVNVELEIPAKAVSVGAAPVILFVGDLLEPRKGAVTLCKAFVEVKKKVPTVELQFSGNISEGFKQSINAIPGIDAIKSSIKFHGVGKIESLPLLYANASVTVLPSVWEAFGLVLIESLAMGTPVVGSRHAGITDIIRNDDIGRLFDPGSFQLFTDNYAELAQGILEVLEFTSNKETMAACHKRALDFSWHRLGPRYESYYRSLVNET